MTLNELKVMTQIDLSEIHKEKTINEMMNMINEFNKCFRNCIGCPFFCFCDDGWWCEKDACYVENMTDEFCNDIDIDFPTEDLNNLKKWLKIRNEYRYVNNCFEINGENWEHLHGHVYINKEKMLWMIR